VVKVVVVALGVLEVHTEMMTVKGMELRVEEVAEEGMGDMVEVVAAVLPSGSFAHLTDF